ncbi:MAG: cyclic nucleotide-binding domain-containing protein [Deltaproteobacteria bacterium]|nr:cyclic nucleotide-binding domain-containing protein [Deltaproteobacteria bacterium]
MPDKDAVISAARDRAEALFAKGMYREALSAYGEIRSRGPNDPRILLRMGDISRRLEDLAGAVDCYKEAAEGFAKLGFTIKAVAVCKMIMNIDPSREDVQQRLSELCAGGGGRKEDPAEKPFARRSGVKVPRAPLFSDFTEPEFIEAVKKVSSRRLAAGSILFNEGESGNSIFIIADGSVDVIGKAKDGREVRLARLDEGSVFGEFGFFLNSRRLTAVKAHEDSTVLELTGDDLNGMISKHPRVEEVLFGFYKERVVDRLMALCDVFAPLSGADRREVLQRLTMEKFPKGGLILREHDRGDIMYLIKKGRVSVWATDRTGARKELAELVEGDFFGEIALATARPRVASVTALSDVELVVFSRQVIKDILGKYPRVKAVLENVIKERVLDAVRAMERRGALI